MRALIVDDEPLVRRGIRGFLSDEPDVTVVGECRNGVEALAAIRAERPDLVFLDVQMPELDGLGVLAELGDERPPAVVFVTAFDAYALHAFDVHAVDYLLKPFDEPRFRTALARVRQRLAGTAPALEPRIAALLAELRPPAYLERLVVKTGTRAVPVEVSAVDWIEAADNYVRLHIAGARHSLRESLRALEDRLDPRRFARIHRSAIVNLGRVREIRTLPSGEHAVVLHNGVELPLGRSYRESFEARLGGGI